MMRDAILNFPQQFALRPKIEGGRLPHGKRFVVLGMGGSHLAADLLKVWKPDLPLTVHQDYGLPALPAGDWRQTLVIASSYSGNTEEVLDGFREARRRGLALAAIAVGGKLLRIARAERVPFVQLPDTGIQPRSALGFSLLALLKLLGEHKGLAEASLLARRLKSSNPEPRGQALAKRFRGSVPVIYSSTRNFPIAYNWKIKLNETGKVPAFANALPELNHNEMTGFDVKTATRSLARRFHWVFLTDADDDPRVQKRFAVLAALFRKRDLPVEVVRLTGRSTLEKIFRSLLTADWFALYSAEGYGVESEQVPMVEEFKRRIG